MVSGPQTEIWTGLSGGKNRTALIVRPAGPIRAVWLVFHGVGGTGSWALEESGLQSFARSHNLFLVFPEGRRLNPEKPPGFLQNPQAWEDGSGRFDAFLSPGDDLDYLGSLLERTRQELGTIPTHWIGFSNGAAFAKRAVGAFSTQAQALSMLCGMPFPKPPGDPLPQRWPPTLAILGGVDPILPWKGGQVTSIWTGMAETRPALLPHYLDWAHSLGAPGPLRSDGEAGLERHFLPLGAEHWLEIHQVAEMGHHWPGGLGRINRRLAGPPSWRIDGNALLLDFFERAIHRPASLEDQLAASHPNRWKPVPSTHPKRFA